MVDEIVTIDGSILEGGGQILRNCIAYSALLNKDICIQNVRGKRRKPGLQLQHLTGLKLVSDICKATTSGISRDSTEITFSPNGITPGTYVGEISSAGACTLLAQIALPVVLFASGPTILILKGGTNVPMSPPSDFIREVLFPVLSKFGIEKTQLNMEVVKHGFMPHGGGEVRITIQPMSKGKHLEAINLVDRGDITFCEGHLSGSYTAEFDEELSDNLTDYYDEMCTLSQEVHERRAAETNVDNGQVMLLMVTNTQNECKIAGSALGGKKVSGKQLISFAKKRMISQLKNEKLCVDEYLQDQLIIFMALAKGTSKIVCGKITLHTETAIHFAHLMTGAVFTVESIDPHTNLIACEGIGFTS